MANPRKEYELFRTVVQIPHPLHLFDTGQHYVFLGSCFAQYLGQRLENASLQAVVNPMGAIYSPIVLAQAICGWNNLQPTEGSIGWHTWATDTTFSRPTAQEALFLAQHFVGFLKQELAQADHLVLTFGTTHHYWHRASKVVVANCHKHSQAEFEEQIATLDELKTAMTDALEPLLDQNPHLNVTLTVSPYRYKKYGFHENQLNKATLLLLADWLCHRFPERVQYFPAYEILMDELRDYRFYAPDMLHPSLQAADYIQRRMEEWMTPSLIASVREGEAKQKATEHRPHILQKQ